MWIRLRRPWRGRLIVVGSALVLAVGGVALLLTSEAPPPPYLPPQSSGAHINEVVVYAYESTLDVDLDPPPGPGTVIGAVLLAVSGGLCAGSCLIRRRREAPRV
ncbi:hypothetical protein ACWC9R_29535 [Streptomyces sp. NPDC001219]